MHSSKPLPPVPQPSADGTPTAVQAPQGSAGAPPAGPAWSSEQLFCGRTEIEITHGPHRYRLRQTSLGKLILTK